MMPAIALMRAQKVGKDAPARLLLFCSPLLLLPPCDVEAALLPAAEVLRSTRLLFSKDWFTKELAATPGDTYKLRITGMIGIKIGDRVLRSNRQDLTGDTALAQCILVSSRSSWEVLMDAQISASFSARTT